MLKFFTETHRLYPNGSNENMDLQIVNSPLGHITITYSSLAPLVIDAADSLHLKSFVLEAKDAEILIKCSIHASESLQLTAKQIKCVSATNITAVSKIKINVEHLETEEGSRLSLSSTDADSTLNVNHLCNNGDVAIIGELYGNVAQLSGTGTHDIHLRKNSYRR